MINDPPLLVDADAERTNPVTQARLDEDAVKREIAAAFQRSAEIDSASVVVEIHGDEVILFGTVHSWHQREQAERVA